MFALRSVTRTNLVKSCSSVLRTYASEASSKTEGLIVNFSVPHQAILKNASVLQVNASAFSGDMGILPDHVPSIEQLKPGIIEIIKAEGSEKYFLSGGFMVMNPNSVLNINAVEAFKIADINAEAVSRELAESKRLFSSAKNETEKAAAEIEVELYEALQAALKTN
ncbi:ATP synthase subunit delta, mitochondrial [Smittium mucronatum]|uniref:ATP synthase subunit delta, mitochondrial n=1 Tax=Smittium mucronatum TaxID=133383 RepID=A0A1R0GN63_9FUNG|nr:ATP synthase subunit delta, mitochondrial [Smittium mucronatum]